MVNRAATFTKFGKFLHEFYTSSSNQNDSDYTELTDLIFSFQ